MGSEGLTLRLAHAEDASTLAAMTRTHIEAGLRPRYDTRALLRLIGSREHVALVADDAQGVQGFAIMSFGDERAHLVLLCVHPAQRRAGVGRRLIDWLVRSAQVAGIATIHLELREDNEDARAFYTALGFTETVRVPGYYDGQIAARRMILVLRQAAASPT